MTREEAIKLLTQYIDYDAETPDYYEMEEACKVALKVLKQEPCEDAISREYILSKAHCCCDDLADDEPCCVDVDDIKNAPSVKPKPIECEDYISRKALLAEIDKERDWLLNHNMYAAEHIVVHHARRIIEDMRGTE